MALGQALKSLGDYYRLSPGELCARIVAAKKERNALLLVHNYQRLEIQHLADVLGDSLMLAREAAKTAHPLIVLCGVVFMAESAKILNPGKRVLIPEKNAGCPMADMITADQLREFKARHPGAAVVCYVNSSAEVKAESDICCTSSNAVKVVQSLGGRKILFVPDKNLASYARKMTSADIIPWEGHCYVHNQFTEREAMRAKALHPQALMVVHPECPPAVADLAHAVASTSGMLELVKNSPHDEFIIGTETGLVERLRELHPDKTFYALRDDAVCVNMKKTDVAKLAWSLETDAWEIIVPEPIRARAYTSLQRMVEV